MYESFSLPEPLQLLGLVGACNYILTYILLTTQRLDASTPPFFVMNLASSTMVLISLASAFNAAAMVVQTFWIMISLWGIGTRLRRRGRGDLRRSSQPDRLQPLR